MDSLFLPSLEVLPRCDSTNTYLLAAPWSLETGRRSVLALQQTAGRGRRGRSWMSDDQGSVCLSVSVDWHLSEAQRIQAIQGLSLALGAAIADALELHLGTPDEAVELGLKWPNDVVIKTPENELLKVVGILVELRHQADTVRVVAGIGVNLCQSQTSVVVDGLSLKPGFWFESSEHVPQLYQGEAGKIALAKVLATTMHDVLNQCEKSGWLAYEAAFLRRNVLMGRQVLLFGNEHARPESAQAVGIDAQGALLVRNGEGVKAMHSGEVSVRLNKKESHA